uniref:DUF4283 domain-containing protein n=1 Tax=Cannabis sativa TaxID=3483 RepID=A0A803PJW3_CANSA
MATFPESHSTQLTAEEALVHDFDHCNLVVRDRRRVMEGQPWHFDRSLMIFAIPDGFDTILPSQLRYIPLWVQYTTFRLVLVPMALPSLWPILLVTLLRKLSLTKWLKFLYEGIHNYCYHCGKLDHTFNKSGEFVHHCDHHPFPPSLSYKDVLRAPAKSIYKKSIFELSTSIPFEEQPTLSNIVCPSLVITESTLLFPPLPYSPHPLLSLHPHSLSLLQPWLLPLLLPVIASSPSPPLHAPVHCPLPVQPFTNATTNPSINKGKDPMYPNTTIPFVSSPPISSLRIHDTPTAPDSTRKRYFARQQCQVGSSVRSMLKRARASHSDYAVVPSMFDNEETAGAAQQPRREK